MRQTPTLRPIGLCIGLVCILTLPMHYKSEAQNPAPEHNAIQEPEPFFFPEDMNTVAESSEIDADLPKEPDTAVDPTETVTSAESGTSSEATAAHPIAGPQETPPAVGVKEADTVAPRETSPVVDSTDSIVVPPMEPSAVTEPPNAETVVGPTETESAASAKGSNSGLTSKEDAAVNAKEVESQRKPLGLIFGLRTGVAIPTQKVIEDFGNSTSVAPIVNIEALYALREWVRVGLMVEWHRHSIKMWGPEFGNLNIVSILPTVELRPTRAYMKERGIDLLTPYASLGLGANANSLSKGSALGNASVSFNDTLAFRVAGGVDFPIMSNLALNTELAWNRNAGGYQLNGTNGSFNASTLNLLIGLRAQF